MCKNNSYYTCLFRRINICWIPQKMFEHTASRRSNDFLGTQQMLMYEETGPTFSRKQHRTKVTPSRHFNHLSTCQDFCRLLHHLLIFLDSLYCKQYGHRSGSSLVRVHKVSFHDKNTSLKCA